ncbi:MAG: ribosomal methyltransferase [Sphingomonas bacterium]|nr:ribosomal methyltransferase [Sphingomonas bacterium]
MSDNRPEWTPQAAESWKLTLPCTKAEAETLADAAGELAGVDPPPVLMTSEPDPARPDDWQLDAYFEGRPDAAALAAVRALVPSADGIDAVPERIEDRDWVTLSQAWLEPIRAGRFHVHTAAYADDIPPDAIAFRIEASRAFGTGHHETTTGCLTMLDSLARSGARFAEIADIGTGTGLLAFGARALWPDARVIATDIDPVSIEVTAENMAVNAIPAGAIDLVVAPGVDDPAIEARRYDLLIANILAGPLIELAPSFAKVVAPGGSVMLAGLLATQADAVIAAYAAQGIRLADRLDLGDWTILHLTR